MQILPFVCWDSPDYAVSSRPREAKSYVDEDKDTTRPAEPERFQNCTAFPNNAKETQEKIHQTQQKTKKSKRHSSTFQNEKYKHQPRFPTLHDPSLQNMPTHYTHFILHTLDHR